jgi:hypothetical protein
MRDVMKVLILAGLALSSLALPAQEEKAEPNLYTYATYLSCDYSSLSRANELLNQYFAPIYDQAVKDEVISRWGWGSHHTGGEWSRVLYHQNPSLEQAIAAVDELQKRFTATGGEGGKEFGRICSRHTDYVWLSLAGDGANRGPAGLSVYYECDIDKEDRADELMMQVYGPVLDKHLGEGKLSSWGWSSQVLGGKYRRLATTTAADFSILLKQRAQILEQILANPLAREFSSICHSRVDYLWRLPHEG